jgi:nicotinamidase-related amidase
MIEFCSAKTALVIVDLQNDFVRIGGALEVPDARKTIPVAQKMIALARKKGMPVIFTKFVAGPKRTLLWNWSPQIEKDKCCVRGYKRYYPEEGKELEVTEIISELKPEPQDYIIEKYGYSSFRNTRLQDILMAEDRDSIIVLGTVTQICVEDTVHDAFHLGIKTLVVKDGVSSFDKQLHDAALKNFEMKYAVVMDSDQVMKLFE